MEKDSFDNERDLVNLHVIWLLVCMIHVSVPVIGKSGHSGLISLSVDVKLSRNNGPSEYVVFFMSHFG